MAAFGFDVVLENDVNLGAQGEAWQRAGQGLDGLRLLHKTLFGADAPEGRNSLPPARVTALKVAP